MVDENPDRDRVRGPGHDVSRASEIILAIDPGRSKCGYALVNVCPGLEIGREVHLLQKGITPTSEILTLYGEFAWQYPGLSLLVGAGTGSQPVILALEAAGAPCQAIEERWTTHRARERYFLEHPPRGFKRLLPKGLLTPPGPVDDFAALLLAEDWVSHRGQSAEGG